MAGIPDLEERLERFRNSARDMDAVRKALEEQAAQAESERQALELRTKRAEEKAALAAAAEENAEQRLAKAVELQKGQYAELIAELFESPRENLETSIRTQSFRSNRLTLLTALFSIGVTTMISVYYQWKSNESVSFLGDQLNNATAHLRQQQETIEDLTTALRTVREETARSSDEIRFLTIDGDSVRSIMEAIRTNSNEFGAYGTKNALRLAYATRLAPNVGPTSYSSWLRAFGLAGIPRSSMPISELEVASWNGYALALYENWCGQVEKMPATMVASKEWRTYKSFKNKGDPTDYGNWRYTDDEMRFGSLLHNVRSARDALRRQRDFNRNIQATHPAPSTQPAGPPSPP